MRWVDFDTDAGTLAVTGKVVRIVGKGLAQIDEATTAAGKRTIPLPTFAVMALTQRRSRPDLGEQPVIFPSTMAHCATPNNFGKQWRIVRDDLGVSDNYAQLSQDGSRLIDDAGLSPRVGADELGLVPTNSDTPRSMTQDRYMARGRVHTEVAELLDGAIKSK